MLHAIGLPPNALDRYEPWYAAIALSTLFQNQNIAFLMGLAFALAASANFPVLVLTLFWKRLTARGARWGALSGILAALAAILTGPAVWTGVLALGPAPFPYANPALCTVPLAFAAAWLGTLTDPTAKRALAQS